MQLCQHVQVVLLHDTSSSRTLDMSGMMLHDCTCVHANLVYAGNVICSLLARINIYASVALYCLVMKFHVSPATWQQKCPHSILGTVYASQTESLSILHVDNGHDGKLVLTGDVA